MKQAFKHPISAALGAAMAAAMVFPGQAMAQSTPFLGQMAVFGFNFCPTGWAEANGQLMAISQNTALFSLLGTQYGGNGVNTFALPDLRGRVPINSGQGPGLANHDQGEVGGAESFTLQVQQLPPHNHAIWATSEAANRPGPYNKLLARDDTVNKYSDTTNAPDKTMSPAMVGNTGGGQPVAKRDPYVAMKWCIALQGVFPSRN